MFRIFARTPLWIFKLRPDRTRESTQNFYLFIRWKIVAACCSFRNFVSTNEDEWPTRTNNSYRLDAKCSLYTNSTNDHTAHWTLTTPTQIFQELVPVWAIFIFLYLMISPLSCNIRYLRLFFYQNHLTILSSIMPLFICTLYIYHCLWLNEKRRGYIKYEEQSKKCIKYEVKVYKVYYVQNETNYEQSRNRIYTYRNQRDQLCWQRIDQLPDDRVWRVIRKKWPINELFGKMLVFEFCIRWWPKARTSRLTYGTQQRVHGRRHVKQEFTVKPVGIAAGSINSFGIVLLENGTGSSHEIGFQPSFVGSANIHRFITRVRIQRSLNAIFNSFSCFDKRTVLWHDVFSLICDIYI